MNIRSKEQWFELFKAHEQSGFSLAEFCRRKNLNKKYFSLRRQQLAFKVNQQKPLAKDFIKVSVKTSPASGLSLTHGKVELNWQELPPAHWLSDFIKTLV